MLTAVFYIVVTSSTMALQFPINQYFSKVEGFNTDWIIEELSPLGFYESGVNKELQVDLKTKNSESFFNSLFPVVVDAVNNLDISKYG